MKNFENTYSDKAVQNESIDKQSSSFRYSICLSSHPGKVRKNNEDNYVVNVVIRPQDKPEINLRGKSFEEPLVCGVFDGMGGEANGELASQTAAETSVKIYHAVKNNVSEPDAVIEKFINDSNRGIIQMLSDTKARRGGTTFVAAVICNGMVHAYSLGDSRMYLYSGGKLTRITNDHTLGMKKYYANIYTYEEAITGPDSHKLTAYLGMETEADALKPEKYAPFMLGINDKLLLCSDGLYDMCNDSEIASILDDTTNSASWYLKEKAIANGGIDNVTCIVVEREA